MLLLLLVLVMLVIESKREEFLFGCLDRKATGVERLSTPINIIARRLQENGPNAVNKRTPPLKWTSSKGFHGKSNAPPPPIGNKPHPVNCETLQRTQGTSRGTHGTGPKLHTNTTLLPVLMFVPGIMMQSICIARSKKQF